MKLRKPCQHGRYDKHEWAQRTDHPVVGGYTVQACPGGEFLADDALIIEDRDEFVRALGLSLWRVAGDDLAPSQQFFADLRAALDALSLRDVT